MGRSSPPAGSIFIGTNGDGYFRAFDKDTGATLFERALDANPEGMVAVYEVAGRQYVAFCASYYPEVAADNIAIFPGKREAQGYYVFALPKKATEARKHGVATEARRGQM